MSALNNRMAAGLRRAGYNCDQAFTGEQALALAARKTFDLVLLDAALPGVNGTELLGKLPPDQPVLLVTGQADADHDCLVRPFTDGDLLTRTAEVLRRCGRGTTVFTFRDLVVDRNARQVRRAGRPVNLTPQEFALLEALVANPNLALSRERLLALAWGYNYEGETRTVDVHIQRLRRKLGLQREIQTVFKVGYRLNTRD